MGILLVLPWEESLALSPLWVLVLTVLAGFPLLVSLIHLALRADGLFIRCPSFVRFAAGTISAPMESVSNGRRQPCTTPNEP